MTTYIQIDSDGWHVEPRVAAAFIWRDHVLLQRAMAGEFSVLPGGRLLPLELSSELPASSPFLHLDRDHAGVERGQDLVLRWFPIAALPDVPLVPDFLRTALRKLPSHTTHIVRHDTTIPAGRSVA